jgi:hypothetical protein
MLSEADRKLRLEMSEDKITLVTLQHGANFLGYHISTTIKVKRDTRDEMLKTLSARYYERDEKRF